MRNTLLFLALMPSMAACTGMTLAADWGQEVQVDKLPIYLATRGSQVGVRLPPLFFEMLLDRDFKAWVEEGKTQDKYMVAIRTVRASKVDPTAKTLVCAVEGVGFTFRDDAFIFSGGKLPVANASLELGVSAAMKDDKEGPRPDIGVKLDDAKLKTNILFGWIDDRLKHKLIEEPFKANIDGELAKFNAGLSQEMAQNEQLKRFGYPKAIEYTADGVRIVFDSPAGQPVVAARVTLAAALFLLYKDLTPLRVIEVSKLQKENWSIPDKVVSLLQFEEIVEGSNVQGDATRAKLLIFSKKIDNKSVVKVNAAGGVALIVSKIDDHSDVTIEAPGGRIVSIEQSGVGREGSKIDGKAVVHLTAKDVDLRGVINGGKETNVCVNLTGGGRLLIREIDGGARVFYRKGASGDADPQVGERKGGATVEAVDHCPHGRW